VFPSSDGGILDPDNLYHCLFIPELTKAGIRKIRLHDLRHTFGSVLFQRGATLTYVKEQLGHASIQTTIDIYGHLVPGADVSFVDRLDAAPSNRAKTPIETNRLQLLCKQTQTRRKRRVPRRMTCRWKLLI
jgi:integrase